MGTWDTGILENDGALDVYGFFENLYNQQELDIENIKLETLNKFGLYKNENEPVYGNEEWLAYALICWETKSLDEKTFSIINEIATDKENIVEEWEELADERIEKINKFLIKIQTPVKRKKKIKKSYIPKIPFLIGDCIVFERENGFYGGAILIDIDKDKKEINMYSYFLGITRIYSKSKPTYNDFIDNHFLVVNYGKTIDEIDAVWNTKPKLWISGRFVGTIKNEKEKLEVEVLCESYDVVGQVNFITKPQYDQSYGMGLKLDYTYQFDSQFNWESENPTNIDLSYPISKYTKSSNIIEEKTHKKSWKFWK